MNLQNIADELNKKIDFPYVLIRREGQFIDSVYIVIALEKKELWPHGYIENSHYIKASIFCSDEQREREDSLYNFEVFSNTTGVKLLQRKKLTGDKILKHFLKQAEKLQQAGH